MIGDRTERPAFGALLRRRRIAARLSQEQLAERARISVQAVSALERGARRSPRADTLALLIHALALEGAELATFEATARASVAMKVRTDGVASEAEPAARAHLATPVAETSFVGRERELDAIVRAFATHRCTTLWGPGGVGKTRLALESLRPLAATFGDRMAFVALAAATDRRDVVRGIAAAYDLVDGDLPTLLKHLAGRLTSGRALLVLDNCEQIVGEVSEVAATALAWLPELSVLATSREPLRIDAERVEPVSTFAVPRPGTATAETAAHDAVRLFLDRAAAATGSDAASADLERVATICRRLDGLPLAIELAAARTRSLSVGEIERALDERFSLLTRGNRGLDRRQQTLRDAIAWSYDLLATDRRIVFERLALLGGTFTIEDAVAIASDAELDRWTVLDAVADLVDKALVAFAPEPDDGGDRPYTLLESTRLFALGMEGAAADPDRDGAWRRFGLWLLDRADESFASYVDESAVRADRIDADHLRGYLRWALDGDGDVPTATSIVAALAHWYDARALQDEGLRWLETALAKPSSGDVALRARVRALLCKTNLLRGRSFLREAVVPALEAHALAQTLCTEDVPDRLLARTAFYASESMAYLGRHDEAATSIRSSIGIYEALGDPLGAALALSQAGILARYAGDLALSRTCYADSMTVLEGRGRRRLAAHARANLAEIDFALGDVTAAVEGARAAAADILELSSSYYLAVVLSNLAVYTIEAGRLVEAAAYAERALDIAREAGFERIAANALVSCALVAMLRGGVPVEAATLLGFASPRLVNLDIRYTERRQCERLQSILSERLAEDALAAAMRHGRGLGEPEAVRLARCAVAS